MVKHESHTCDMCDEVFIKSGEVEYAIISRKEIEDLKSLERNHGSISYVIFKYTNSGMDLCTKCQSELKQWIETKPRRLTA